MATSAAVVVAAARRKVVSHFMSQNAVSAKDAVPFEPARRVQRRQFERMVKSGVVEETKEGRYWLNVPAYDAWKSRARKRVAGAMGLVAVAGALAAIFAG